MKNTLKIVMALLITVIASCSDDIPQPDPAFKIEKDTVINDLKTRIEVSYADTINPIYFVYQGHALFNSVWPGDMYKSAVVLLDKPMDLRNKHTLIYYVNQNYDTRLDSVIIGYQKKDSLMSQNAILNQGLGLTSGSNELQYTFKSKGNLVVTWVSTNVSANNSVSKILQKKIIVR